METRKILVILVLALGLMVCWPRTVGGAEPMSSAFTYQGQLYDANYVANGLYDFQFKLWTDPCRSEALFKIGDDVNIPNVDVIDGYFTVELDGFMPIPWWAFDGNARWLEIGIRPGDLNDPNVYSVLSPRQEITPTPYAIYGLRSDYAGSAGDAGTLGGYYYTDFAWSVHTHSGSDIDSGAVGEGYIDGLIARDSEIMSWVLAGDGSGSGLDADLLDGQDSAAFAAVSHSHDGVYALVTHNHDSSYSPIGHNHDGSYAPIIHEHDDRYYSESESDSRFVNVTGDSISASSDGQVLRVSNTGTHYGITAIAGGIYGRAVYGSATNSGDVTNYGGYFKADGNTARAVYGEASNNGNSYNYGGYFVADGNTGRGVYGSATGSSGIGVYGRVSSNNGIGVKGYASYSGNVENYGGHFWASGVRGRAVYGKAIGSQAYAGYFEATGTNGTGVYASGGTSGYAGEFDGDVIIHTGRFTTPVLEITGGADLSERFEVRGIETDASPSPGMVVSIDPEAPGELVISNKAYDRRVAGIISGAGDVKGGMLMGQKGTEADGDHPVALTGRMYCRADASNWPIEPGDLLTTSKIPGHAMKVTDYVKAQGAILGKAMTPLADGQGLVLVLVTLQ